MTDHEIILVLLKNAEAIMGRRFQQLMMWARDNAKLSEMERLISQGRHAEILYGLDNAIAATLGSQWVATYINAGARVAEALSTTLGQPVNFDQTVGKLIEEAKQARLTLIAEIGEQQRQVVRHALEQGMRSGVNPREVARGIRSTLGLTTHQWDAVVNYRRLLEAGDPSALSRKLRDARFDRTVEGAINGRAPLTKPQIDRMVERYTERYLKYRAEVVARTEALRAVHAGVEEVYRQAIEVGTIKPEKITRTWRTRLDGRQRDWHGSMNGQKRPLGVPFTSGQGYLLRFPGDFNAPASETIQCRCVVVTRIRA